MLGHAMAVAVLVGLQTAALIVAVVRWLDERAHRRELERLLREALARGPERERAEPVVWH